jgi:hypothetical protein
VRGVAINVLRAMGLEAASCERRTRISGITMLNADGVETWRSDQMTKV